MNVDRINTRQTYATIAESATVVISEREAKFLYHALYAIQANNSIINKANYTGNSITDDSLKVHEENLMLLDKMKQLLMPTLREILVPVEESDFLSSFNPINPEPFINLKKTKKGSWKDGVETEC